jgi:hypothetical protein
MWNLEYAGKSIKVKGGLLGMWRGKRKGGSERVMEGGV